MTPKLLRLRHTIALSLLIAAGGINGISIAADGKPVTAISAADADGTDKITIAELENLIKTSVSSNCELPTTAPTAPVCYSILKR